MKLVTFESLTLKNFLSFKDEVQVKLPTSGLHLVRGENLDLQNSGDEVKNTNGSGKSALLRSLLWVLFGENNKRGKSDNVINKKSKRDTVVSVVFTVSNSTYKVTRHRKTSSGSGLLLYKLVGDNYVDESFSDVKLTQEKLNELIGFNYETALYTLLVSKEYNTNLIEAPWNVRSSFLEGLMRVDALKGYVKLVKDKLSEDKKKYNENEKAYNSAIGSTLTLRSVLTKSLELKKKERNSDREAIKKLLRENDVHHPPNLLEELRCYLLYYNENKKLEKLSSEVSSNYNSLLSSLSKYKKSKLSYLNSLREYEEHNTSKSAPCEHCGVNLEVCASPTLLNSLSKSVTLSKQNVSTYRHYASKELKTYRSNVAKHVELVAEVERLKSNCKLSEHYVKLLLADVSRGVDPTERYVEHAKYVEALNTLKSKKYPTLELWSHLRRYREEKNKKEQLYESGKLLQKRVALGEFLDATLDFKNEGSLKNYVVSKVVPVFNNVLKSVLDVVFEGKVTVTFDNLWSENISVDGEEYDYSQLSLGEKGKLNLCISLALFSLFRVNLGGTSVLFIDEGFSHIDEGSIEKFLQLLRSTYCKETAVFIVSHEYGLRNFVPDSTYVVTKRNGESTLRLS